MAEHSNTYRTPKPQGAETDAPEASAVTKASYLLFILAAVAVAVTIGLLTARFAAGTPARGRDAPATAEVVRAERFELVNEGGEVRAALVPIEDNVGLVLFGTDARPQVLIEMGGSGAQLKLLGRAHAARTAPTKAESLARLWHFSYGASARAEDTAKAPH